MDLVDYSLYDPDGDYFTVRITKSKAAALDMNEAAVYRFINSLRQRNVQPTGRWIPLGDLSTSTEPTLTVSQWEPGQSSTPTRNSNKARMGKETGPQAQASTTYDGDLRSPAQKKSRRSDLNDSLHNLSLREEEEGAFGGDDGFEQDFQPLNDNHENNGEGAHGFEQDFQPLNDNDENNVEGAHGFEQDFQPLNDNDENNGEGAQPNPVHAKLVRKWVDDDRAVHMLLNEYGRRLHLFKSKRVHKPYWTEISQVLLANGYDFSNEKCRVKKSSLMSYFTKLKGSGGYIGKVKYPFYDALFHIDRGTWPEGFISGSAQTVETVNVDDDVAPQEDVGEDLNNNEAVNQMTYVVKNPKVVVRPPPNTTYVVQNPTVAFPPRNQTYVVENPRVVRKDQGAVPAQRFKDLPGDCELLEEYEDQKEQWQFRVWNIDLFHYDVSKALKDRGFEFDPDYCKRRLGQLQDRYRRIFDGLNGTGSGANVWPLYDICERVYGPNNVTVSPKKTVSVGAAARLEMNKQEVTQAARSSKERPPSVLRKKQEQTVSRLVGSRPIGKRDQMLQIQQRRLELDETFVQEFQSFRADMNARAATLQQGVEAVRDLRRQRANMSTFMSNSDK